MIDAPPTIGEIPVGETVRPESEADVSALLRGLEGDAWVLPVGGGMALSAGNAVEDIPILLDTTGMAGIIEYEPTDLTVSVRAGTRWADLAAALAEHEQCVPVDVAFPDLATVGGVVATGWAGHRRLRDGTLKDLLIGAGFVGGDGRIAKAGGMVVKNVSGFEIPRLLHGSQGALAVLTSVNLKVVPTAESELTLRSMPLAVDEAAGAVLAMTREQPAIAAAVVEGDGETGKVAVRLSGPAAPIRELAGRIRQRGVIAFEETLEEGASGAFWREAMEASIAPDADRVAIEIGCPALDSVSVMGATVRALGGATSLAVTSSPGTGSVTVRFDAASLSHHDWLDAWLREGLASQARHVVHHAPRDWRIGHDVFDVPADQRALMLALKAQFDPARRLNRGRLWDTAPLVPTECPA